MQYADIALSVKTKNRQGVFTYAIPPSLLPDLSVGQRVIVPFAGRTLTGTLVQFRRIPPKTTRGLKEIKRLAEPFALVDARTIELAEAVASHYAATVGDVLASALPKPAPRTSKRLTLTRRPSTKRLSDGTVYGLYGPRQERLKQYIRLIAKVSSNNEQVLLLFASHEKATLFSDILQRQGISSILLPPAASYSEAYEAWVRAKSGECAVIIGTRKSIFLPLASGGVIVIDEPSEYGYKEEQFPYYSAVTVGKLRAKLEGISLFLGDIAPRLAEWHELQQRHLTPVYMPLRHRPEITTIDTSSGRGLFTESLLNHMRRVLENNGRICLFFNRKGVGRFYRCLDCETAIYCPRCDTLLHVASAGEGQGAQLLCGQCGYETTPPYRCTACGSYRLGSAGLGIESFAKIVAEHFPNVAIATLSKEGGEAVESASIVIATAQLFSQPLTRPYDLLAVFRLDQLLHGSSWDTNEEAFITLKRLAERTTHLVLLTSEPDKPVLRAFYSGEIDAFYASEFESRKTAGYPPASPLIRLTIADTDKASAKTKADELYSALEPLVRSEQLLPPSPIGSGKRRDKYRYQIIIKAKLTEALLQAIPTNWQIDPEPDRLT